MADASTIRAAIDAFAIKVLPELTAIKVSVTVSLRTIISFSTITSHINMTR